MVRLVEDRLPQWGKQFFIPIERVAVSAIPVPVTESVGWVYSMWHIREQTYGSILIRLFELHVKCLLTSSCLTSGKSSVTTGNRLVAPVESGA
jgi:hypothetical protein